MDAVLPMGCSSSCEIFECFSTALEWAAKVKLGVTGMVHVIDNFLLLAHSVEKCNHDLTALVALCKQIGVPLAPSKTVRPSSFYLSIYLSIFLSFYSFFGHYLGCCPYGG